MSESTPPPAPGATTSSGLLNSPEGWAQKKNTPLAWLYGARAQARWAENTFLSEADFDAAVDAVKDLEINAVHGPKGA